MADSLYLSLWFPSFLPEEMMPRTLSVLRQFPFSAERTGIGYVGVHGIAWSLPVIFEETFDFRADPKRAVLIVSDFLHADYGYVFEAMWDLWTPLTVDDEAGENADWVQRPAPVDFLVRGTEFDAGSCQEQGHIQIDFGLDTAFLHEDVHLTELSEARVKANVHKLVTFTTAVEKNCGITGRVLWSESEENLAQKLIARLQRVQ